jgi:hypothetical protein
MYNLMVTAGDNAWEEGAYIWDKPRLFEYTPEEIKERFRPLSAETIEMLKTFPTLFMYERGTEGTPRVGRIKEVQTRRTQVRIEFEFDAAAPLLTLVEIEELQWHLEMEDFEFSRTHWAVKNADLGKVLSKLPSSHSADVIGAIEAFGDDDKTLEELIGAIQRDLRAGRYEGPSDATGNPNSI